MALIPTKDDLERLVEGHLKETLPQASARIARSRVVEEAYKPVNVLVTGAWDTWPWHAPLGQSHVSVPMVWYTVNVMASLLGIRPPRFIVRPKTKPSDDTQTVDEKKKSQPTPEDLAAQAENDLIDKAWEDQEMDVVHMDFAKTLVEYGDAILKHGFENKEIWTENVDLPYTVWVAYRGDNFREPQTISHSYVVTDETAKELGWSGVEGNAKETIMFNPKLYGLNTHDNPLGLGNMHLRRGAEQYFPGRPVIEFYFKWGRVQGVEGGYGVVTRAKGTHYYAKIVAGEVVVAPTKTKLDDFPFLFCQAEHIPGEKHGVGDAEPILDIQDEYNQRLTVWSESIRRNIKDQWKAWGLRDLTPAELPGGARLFELQDKTTDDIEPLKFPIDNAGIKEYLEQVLEDYRRITGIPPEVLGGGAVNAETSGYAVQVKYQAVINRLEPRRIRMKRMYKKWGRATLKKYAIVHGADPSLFGERLIDIDFDLITPRDFQQTVQTIANARTAKLMSQFKAIEEIGEDPIEEQARMRMEETDVDLFPEQAMTAAQARQTMAQLTAEGAQDMAAKQASKTEPQLSQMDNQHVNPMAGRTSAAASAMSGPGVQPANVGGNL